MSQETFSFESWMQADIRLGTITTATLPDWSNKLIQLSVDFGQELGQKTIFTAMRSWKSPEDFVGKQSLFLVNLPEKKMGDAMSQGMILALDGQDGDNDEPTLLLWDNLGPNGSKVA